jgi:transcriptional regulator with XRE-family HTH domain
VGSRRARTLTGSTGPAASERHALVSGYVLRLARESLPGRCSQEQLAETAGVSPDTVAGWESGRRPITATTAGQLVRLRSLLIRAGAAPGLIRVLDPALEADQILDHALEAGNRHEAGRFHPLGAHVHRREVIELAAWPLSGRTPIALSRPVASRRGPVPAMPDISPDARHLIHDHLRRVSQTAGDDPLLRRQALYLQSYDYRPDASAWMKDQYQRVPRRHAGWTPDWPVIRTLAASMARYGSPEALVEFSERGLADEPGAIANLNYWAYWVGETATAEPDDSFMPTRLGQWHGQRILRHLSTRLDAGEGVTELGIHTICSLLAARPRLLEDDPPLALGVAAAGERIIDTRPLPPAARQALSQVRYAIRLHTR